MGNLHRIYSIISVVNGKTCSATLLWGLRTRSQSVSLFWKRSWKSEKQVFLETTSSCMHFFLFDHTTFKCCSKWFKLFSSSVAIFLKLKWLILGKRRAVHQNLKANFLQIPLFTYQLKVAHWLLVHWNVVSARMNDTEINILVRNTSADVTFRFREAPE